MHTNRRTFIKQAAGAGLALGVAAVLPWRARAAAPHKRFFDISLAEWSLHKALFAGRMTNLDFPVMARQQFGVDGVEYVSVFFDKKEQDKQYLRELKQRCDDHNVRSVLIMVDRAGNLGAPDDAERNHVAIA